MSLILDPQNGIAGDTHWLYFRGEKTLLFLGPDLIWRDDSGMEYGYENNAWSVDDKMQIGIGPISLPKDDPFNEAAVFHDHALSNVSWEKSHNRSEADSILKAQLEEIAKGMHEKYGASWRDYFPEFAYFLTHTLGLSRFFWENPLTNK